jgi:hypothetical protein
VLLFCFRILVFNPQGVIVKSFKLNLLAASALLAAGAASAQDIPKFEIYGVVGAGVVSADGFGAGTNKIVEWLC